MEYEKDDSFDKVMEKIEALSLSYSKENKFREKYMKKYFSINLFLVMFMPFILSPEWLSNVFHSWIVGAIGIFTVINMLVVEDYSTTTETWFGKKVLTKIPYIKEKYKEGQMYNQKLIETASMELLKGLSLRSILTKL